MADDLASLSREDLLALLQQKDAQVASLQSAERDKERLCCYCHRPLSVLFREVPPDDIDAREGLWQLLVTCLSCNCGQWAGSPPLLPAASADLSSFRSDEQTLSRDELIATVLRVWHVMQLTLPPQARVAGRDRKGVTDK